MRVLDARDGLYFLAHEMADVGGVIDIEFHQQVVVAGGGLDLRGDFGFGQRVGDGVGLAKLALELDKEGDHRDSPETGYFIDHQAQNRGRRKPPACRHLVGPAIEG